MNFGSTFVALETSGRLFGLDYQLLFDAAITAINVFILFLLLSVILFNPVRNMLKKRQDKITSDRETANQSREEALAMKAEYEEKLKAANKEAELILSDARKTAVHNEQKIIDEAKEEAARIIERANKEAELEKQKKHKFGYTPQISVAVPAFRTPEVFLRQMIQSLLDQTYPNWELCIATVSYTHLTLPTKLEV